MSLPSESYSVFIRHTQEYIENLEKTPPSSDDRISQLTKFLPELDKAKKQYPNIHQCQEYKLVEKKINRLFFNHIIHPACVNIDSEEQINNSQTITKNIDSLYKALLENNRAESLKHFRALPLNIQKNFSTFLSIEIGEPLTSISPWEDDFTDQKGNKIDNEKKLSAITFFLLDHVQKFHHHISEIDKELSWAEYKTTDQRYVNSNTLTIINVANKILKDVSRLKEDQLIAYLYASYPSIKAKQNELLTRAICLFNFSDIKNNPLFTLLNLDKIRYISIEQIRTLIAKLDEQDRNAIFYHLWIIKGSPQNIDRFGEFAFLEENGHTSSLKDKTQAVLAFAGQIDTKHLYREIFKTVISRDPMMLEYASAELRNDKEIVKMAVAQDGKALQYSSEELSDDKEIVKMAVAQDGKALQYASEELRNDKEIVKMAVARNCLAFKYASEELKNDKETVIMVITESVWAFEDASKELRNDKEFVKIIVAKRGIVLSSLLDEFKNDKEIVKIAVAQNGTALQFASEELKNDKEIVKIAVAQDGMALQFASEKLKNDREIAQVAIFQATLAIEYISLELLEDDDLLFQIIRKLPDLPFRIAKWIKTYILDNPFDVFKKNKDLLIVLRNPRCFTPDQAAVIQDKLIKSSNNFRSIPAGACPFFDLLLHDVLSYKHPEIKDFMLIQILSLDAKQTFDINKKITDCLGVIRPENTVTEKKLLYPLFISLCCNTSEDVQKALSTLFYAKKRIFKNSSNLQPLLLLFIELYKVNSPANYKIMHDAIVDKENQLMLKTINYLTALIRLNPSSFEKLKDLPKSMETIVALLIAEIERYNIIPLEGDRLAAIEKILSYRKPEALITYASKFIEDPQMVKAIQTMITEDANGSFQAFRHQHNPHKDMLTPAQKIAWEKSIDAKKCQDILKDCTFSKKRSFNIKEFLYNKLVVDNHDGNQLKKIKPFIQADYTAVNLSAAARKVKELYMSCQESLSENLKALDTLLDSSNLSELKREIKAVITHLDTNQSPSFDIKKFLYHTLVKDNLGGDTLATIVPFIQADYTEKDLSAAELKVKELYFSSQESLAENLDALNRLLNLSELKNDITGAIKQLHSSSESIITVVDTEDAEDLFLCGTEVEGSCQRVDGNPHKNCCLMDYVLDGKIRLLAVKNEQGKIISRCIIKLLLNAKNEPCIFFERIYGDGSFRDPLLSLAREKAKEMNVGLYENTESGEILHSLGSVAPYEYEDGGGVKVCKGGKYSVHAISL